MRRRFTHPNAPSNLSIPVEKLLLKNEAKKKSKYASRVINTERATFIPLVFTTAGHPLPQSREISSVCQSNLALRRAPQQQQQQLQLVSNRRDACLLAQLRSGHCKQLAHYANRIDEKTSPTCRRCNKEPETVEHWLKCPATVMKRQQQFGRDNVDLGILSRDPERSLAFAKATLL